MAATWTSFTNRASNAPFTVLDDTTSLGTTLVNQRLAPSGFSDAGATWQYLDGLYTISSSTLVVQLTDQANGNLNADAIRIERVEPAPEIEVLVQDTNVADGSGVVDFGATLVGLPVSRTFTVRNRGLENLTLSGPISVPSGFTLVSSFGATTLAPDQSTTFEIRFNAGTWAILAARFRSATTIPTRARSTSRCRAASRNRQRCRSSITATRHSTR